MCTVLTPLQVVQAGHGDPVSEEGGRGDWVAQRIGEVHGFGGQWRWSVRSVWSVRRGAEGPVEAEDFREVLEGVRG